MKVDIKELCNLAILAGEKIMEIYATDFEAEEKIEEEFGGFVSPLTKADTASHEIICKKLSKLYPMTPIISEESPLPPYEVRKKWERFFLIDPLDGTKNFVDKSGEFTVNIALIEKRTPIFGIVYAPVTKELYFNKESSAYKKANDALKKIPLKGNKRPYRVVASKNHKNEQTKNFISSLQKKRPNLEVISFGSSLKICKVAEGSADIYPRLGQTKEWDTAAAHAIILASGKNIQKYNPLTKETEGELEYNKESLENPWFVVK